MNIARDYLEAPFDEVHPDNKIRIFLCWAPAYGFEEALVIFALKAPRPFCVVSFVQLLCLLKGLDAGDGGI